jgi:hypothetical protein
MKDTHSSLMVRITGIVAKTGEVTIAEIFKDDFRYITTFPFAIDGIPMRDEYSKKQMAVTRPEMIFFAGLAKTVSRLKTGIAILTFERPYPPKA